MAHVEQAAGNRHRWTESAIERGSARRRTRPHADPAAPAPGAVGYFVTSRPGALRSRR